MKRNVLFILLAITNVSIYAQNDTIIKTYISDFDVFIQYIEETHPDPYTSFGGKVKFNEAIQHTKTKVKKCVSKQEFAEILTDFTAALKDGHTFIYRNEKRRNQEIIQKYFPIVFKVATDGLFIGFTGEKYKSHIGDRLLAVNELDIEELVRKVQNTEATENYYGALYTLRNRMANTKSVSKLLGTESTKNVILKLENKDGKTYSLHVDYEKNIQWNRPKSTIHFNRDNELLYYDIISKDNVGYFAWNGTVSQEAVMQLDSSSPQFERATDWTYRIMKQKKPEKKEDIIKNIPELYSSFASLLKEMKAKDTKYLILDLRNNSGGMTPLCMPLLYMLYGDDYLNFNSKAQYNRLLSPLLLRKWGFESIEEYNKSKNKTYKLGDYIFRNFFNSSEGKSIEQKREDLSLISYKNGVGKEYTQNLKGKPIYTPEIIVLTSPKTFSAAYHFLYYLTEIGKATVVGVPPRQAGNAFMETTLFELPNTHIKGSISNSVQIMFPNNTEKGKIFMPDYPMQIKDFEAYNFDRNAEILYVIDLIKKNKISHKEK